MSKHKKFDIEKISVAEMFIVNAAIDNKSELLTLEKEAYSFHFEYSFEPAVNSVEKKVRVVFICDISTFTKGNVEININGKFEIAFIFQVENLEELVDDANDSDFDYDLLLSLNNIAYSTARGIIYTRCQGTILEKLILPILSSQKLVEMLNENLDKHQAKQSK